MQNSPEDRIDHETSHLATAERVSPQPPQRDLGFFFARERGLRWEKREKRDGVAALPSCLHESLPKMPAGAAAAKHRAQSTVLAGMAMIHFLGEFRRDGDARAMSDHAIMHAMSDHAIMHGDHAWRSCDHACHAFAF